MAVWDLGAALSSSGAHGCLWLGAAHRATPVVLLRTAAAAPGGTALGSTARQQYEAAAPPRWVSAGADGTAALWELAEGGTGGCTVHATSGCTAVRQEQGLQSFRPSVQGGEPHGAGLGVAGFQAQRHAPSSCTAFDGTLGVLYCAESCVVRAWHPASGSYLEPDPAQQLLI